MKPETLETVKQAQQIAAQVMVWLKRMFDLTATWVTQLSWWKFFLFAILTMIAGAILQESLFSTPEDAPTSAPKRAERLHANSKAHSFTDGDTHVTIDPSGIHIFTDKDKAAKDADKSKDAEDKAREEQDKLAEEEDKAKENADQTKADEDKAKQGVQPVEPVPPVPGAPTAMPAPPAKPAPPLITGGKNDFHINLPPEVTKEVGDAIDEEVDDALKQQEAGSRKKASAWFMNFVVLLVVCLLGMKSLMGGKKRAEAQAEIANAAAEREALQRQVTEAKMQMMQAQVEPHFLFNTLASVEYLIETDPPRASAMQRSLIQYLRAVLPQMRETAPITNLGREADMVRAYLNLLKMRMEERLHVDFVVPDGLRTAAFPPMMLQSLVENAIKHGLEPKAEGGTLTVRAEVAHNKLCVSVTDDGMGFGVVPSTSTGLGLQSIRERLKLLHGEQAQLIIVPNTPSGVCSTIEVPYQLAK
ncbi:MAG TPA: histidine kinase [Burkholderiaceae bacterium]